MFSIKRSGILCCLPCCFLAAATSAQVNSKPVTLKQLLQTVAHRAPSLLADSATVRIRQSQEDAIRYNWLPSLKLDYQADIGTNNNLPGGYFSYGIVPGNSRVRTENNSSTILTDLGIAAFDWEVYNFGAYGAQRKVAGSDVKIEKARYEESKYDLQTYTIAYYFQLARLQHLLNIQSDAIDRNSEIVRSIRSLARSGVRAGVDTSIAGAELSRARLNYLEINNQLQQVRLQLASISGFNTMDVIPDTTYEEKLIHSFSINALGVADTDRHPILQLYETIVQNSRDREQLVRKSFNPKISLDAAAWGRGSSVSAADEFRNLSTGFGFERSNYLVGLGISYNVFDLKRKQFQLRTQRAATFYAQQKLNEQRTLLDLSRNTADADLQTAIQRLAEIPNQLQAARAAYRQKLALYRNGLTDILELNITLGLLYRAETDFANARYLYCVTLFRKAAAYNDVPELLDAL